MIVSSDGDRGNAVQVFASETGSLSGLDHSTQTYRHLAWHEDEDHLAVLRARSPSPEETPSEEDKGGDDDGKSEGVDTTEYELLAWTDVADAESSSRLQLLDENVAGLGSELYVTADTEPSWSADGARLAIGVRRREPMGQIHWRPGVPEADHWETGQARMVVPYWEDPDGHHRNSPLHGVHEMTTPILMAHGDEDSVVEFFQLGLEGTVVSSPEDD